MSLGAVEQAVFHLGADILVELGLGGGSALGIGREAAEEHLLAPGDHHRHALDLSLAGAGSGRELGGLGVRGFRSSLRPASRALGLVGPVGQEAAVGELDELAGAVDPGLIRLLVDSDAFALDRQVLGDDLGWRPGS